MGRLGNFKAALMDDGRYRLLVDAITDYAIYMLDPTGRITSWNAGAERFKGYCEAEILGENFSRFYTEEDRQAGRPARALAIAAAEDRFESEGWRVRKDGSRFWAHVLIDPIRTPGGELVGYAKVTRDLTERRRAEAKIRESEQQFRLLVQGVTDYALYMLDPAGFVTNWNVGAERIKGYLPDEAIGQHFSRFYTPEDRQAGLPETALKEAVEAGRFEREGWRVRKDGSQFWANVVIDPIRNSLGQIIGFAKITRDITERRRAQEALEQTQQALLQSQKLDAIGRLTGGVAHDFNNLLTAIIGSLELLRKRLPGDPKSEALLENAMLGARRGANLTQRMLAFARKQDLRVEAVDVAKFVGGMTDLLQRSLGSSIEVVTRFPMRLAPVSTDANQLEMALLNLALNARDAMPDGGEIKIEARTVSLAAKSETALPAGDYVKLSVSDTGEGMDADTLARALEPFYTTKGVGKGTGLGLPMVHGLAEQSGGRLSLHSRPGHGTRVDIWLPCASTAPPIAKPLEAPDALAPVRPLSILAVDDDELVLLNIAAMLEDLGHQVHTCSSAVEALSALENLPFDLVITDYAMPRFSGLHLIEALKRDYPWVPVALATGYAELAPGVAKDVARLAKPYGQGELAALIRRLEKA